MNNSYITIIKEKRTVLSRKRVPLNQNECTADFRIGVPFEQNLQFSEALDDAIKRAKYMMQSEDYKVLEKKGGPDYSIQEMRLYSEAAAVEDC